MSALGIHLTKAESNDFLEKADKDGSGFLDLEEFIALMSEIIY